MFYAEIKISTLKNNNLISNRQLSCSEVVTRSEALNLYRLYYLLYYLQSLETKASLN